MENSAKTQTLLESITNQLRLISDTNDAIRQWTAIDGENSLMVRQYRHLKKELVAELDRLLKKIDVTLQVVGC